MRISLTDELFADPNNETALIALLHHALDRRCYLDTQKANGANFVVWYRKLGLAHQQAWNDVEAWSIRDRGLYRLRTWIVSNTTDLEAVPPQFSLADAIRRVTRPLRVWLENDRNDRVFWLSHMRADTRAFILELERQRVLQFESRGGLSELRASLQELYTRGEIDRHDSTILFDGDASVPGDISADAKKMIDFCNQTKTVHLCLSRRAIENYIPKAALYAWVSEKTGSQRANRQKIVDAFYRMAPDQRYHFRLKTGWEDTPSARVIQLYASLSDADRATLASGIATDIARMYHAHLASIEAWSISEGAAPELQSTIDRLSNWVRVPYA